MRVKFFPWQPHCFAFGGFDMQMLDALDSIKNVGVDASKLDIWSRDNNFDIIHLWGVGMLNYHVIDWAKKSGKLIVATVLSPYHDTIRSKLGYYYRYFKVIQLINYYKKIDRIVVLNREQLNVLSKYYKVSPSKIEIIPNIIGNEYFRIPAFDFFKKYGVRNYVLCTGNISRRKNQYNLALACINLNLNLVLIGNILDGEKDYGEKLETLVTKNKKIVWIRELPSGSEELVAAYYNCKVYALPSKNETQPISALEAVSMGKPLILMDRKYARQSFYKDATLCKSPSVKDIEKSLTKVMNDNKIQKKNQEIADCRTEKVGQMYRACYSKLFK
jgi:glycosyltransferase involved in cell wall biosynthesis